MVKFYTDTQGKLPYDPWTTHPIPLADLLACAAAQGVAFRHADILIIRAGFMLRYNGATQDERDGLQGKPETLCVPAPHYSRARARSLTMTSSPLRHRTARASSRARR